MRQRRKPFSIYPRETDMAKAVEIAQAEDLHLSQVFLRAFRHFVKRWERRRQAVVSGKE